MEPRVQKILQMLFVMLFILLVKNWVIIL